MLHIALGALKAIIASSVVCLRRLRSFVCREILPLYRAFVLRMVFATMLFHFMLMAATIGANDFSNPRIIVHTGVWPIKIAVWLLLHLVPFCMPSSFFIGYGWVAFAAGILFLLVQTIIFIEYIFDTNESLIAKDGTDNIKGPWHMLILAASVLMFAGSIAMSVIGFTWFDEVTDGSSTGCGLYTFFNVWNVLLWIGLTLLSFRATEWMPATGLMPSMLVACFMTFKMLSALFAQTQCNDLAAAGADTLYKGPPELIPAVTIIIAVVMQGYASCTISQSMDMDGMFWGPSKNSGGALGPGALGPDGQIHDRQVPLVTMDKITVEPIAENKMEHEEVGVQLQGPIGYNVAAFHLAFWLGICYVGMQLTNWNEDFSKASVDKGVTSMWIKVRTQSPLSRTPPLNSGRIARRMHRRTRLGGRVALCPERCAQALNGRESIHSEPLNSEQIVDSWVLAVAYLWAMIAPKVLRGRSFS